MRKINKFKKKCFRKSKLRDKKVLEETIIPSYIACPYCTYNIPKKYKTRKERRERIDSICINCPNKRAQKKYEEGVKKGIWMKKYRRAFSNLNDAAIKFKEVGDTKSAKTVKLMALLCSIEYTNNRDEKLNIFKQLNESEYDQYRGKNFVVPEFHPFDALCEEAMGWLHYYRAEATKDPLSYADLMNKAAMHFFNIGQRTLIYGRILGLQKNISNTLMALFCIAQSEETLGHHYVELNEQKKAESHLEGAIIAYTNLGEAEYIEKATTLRRKRSSFRMERTCWICGARVRGYNIAFKFVCTNSPVETKEFFKKILEQRKKLMPQLNPESIYSTAEYDNLIDDLAVKTNVLNPGKSGIYLAVCKACESIINELADIIAEQRVSPIRDELALLKNRVENIESSLEELTSTVKKLRTKIKWM